MDSTRRHRPFLYPALGTASFIALTTALVACGGEGSREAKPPELGSSLDAVSPQKPLASLSHLEDASWRLVSSSQVLDGQNAIALDDGTVLLVGGRLGLDSTTNAALVFNPASDAFTALPPMHDSRSLHFAAKLLDGRVLVAGGEKFDSENYDQLASSEVFDPQTSTWTKTGDMASVQFDPSITRLLDGRVLLLGGYGTSGFPTDAAQIFDPEGEPDGIWTPAAALPADRGAHTATLVNDGSVFLAGGRTQSAHSEAFVFSFGQWGERPHLSVARSVHTATALADGGRVLIIGGRNSNFAAEAMSEIHAPIDYEEPIPAAPLAIPRAAHTAALLPDGRVIVVGGESADGPTASTEIYDPATDSFSPGPELNEARHGHRMVMTGSRLVVVGGWSSSGPLSSLEVLDLAAPLGASCSEDAECTSGSCVEGVCCDSPCDGACMACTAALKQKGDDGTCGPASAGTNPRSLCKDEGAASCGRTGVCDASGSCAVYDDGTACSEDKVCQAGACVAVPKVCGGKPNGTECGEADGCTLGLCREGVCVETRKLDGARCEGGVCIAGECKLDRVRTPPSSDGGASGGSGSGDGSEPGSSDGAGAPSGKEGEGETGGCSLSSSPPEPSPLAMGFALLAGLGAIRRSRKLQ